MYIGQLTSMDQAQIIERVSRVDNEDARFDAEAKIEHAVREWARRDRDGTNDLLAAQLDGEIDTIIEEATTTRSGSAYELVFQNGAATAFRALVGDYERDHPTFEAAREEARRVLEILQPVGHEQEGGMTRAHIPQIWQDGRFVSGGWNILDSEEQE